MNKFSNIPSMGELRIAQNPLDTFLLEILTFSDHIDSRNKEQFFFEFLLYFELV